MKIAVLDFESRFTKDILDNLDKINVEHYLFRHDIKAHDIEEYDAIIFTGSYDTVYEGGRLPDPSIMESNKPILGICYGHQLVHYLLGGEVRRALHPQHEIIEVDVYESKLFDNFPSKMKVEMHHDDEVVKMAEGFRCTATNENCKYCASENIDRKIYTVQFHPEAKGNDLGVEVFENFIKILKESI